MEGQKDLRAAGWVWWEGIVGYWGEGRRNSKPPSSSDFDYRCNAPTSRKWKLENP